MPDVAVDTYEAGVTQLLVIIFAVLFTIALLDAICELFDLPSIGERVEQWSKANKWYAGALILLMGMLLAHFLLNPLPCPTAVPSPPPAGLGTSPSAPPTTPIPCPRT